MLSYSRTMLRATMGACRTVLNSTGTRSTSYRSLVNSPQPGLPGDRLPALKQLLDCHQRRSEARPLRILETHSGLTGLIAEHSVGKGGAQFDGMWSSSLTASAVRGMPDIEAVDTTARLQLVRETMSVTTKPMIYDGDTGGISEIFKFTVRSLEQLGVSAVVIEDKEGLKQNSLLEDSNSLHQLCDIDVFCDKIRAGIEARRHPDFMIIARMESLIAGKPMEEALSRAAACVTAGASGIMIHSRKKSPDEVFEFMTRFRSSPEFESVPIVVVPSSYNTVTETELHHAGASICIHANHLLRASYPAMKHAAESILTHSRSHEASRDIMSIKCITGFVDHDAKLQTRDEKETSARQSLSAESSSFHQGKIRGVTLPESQFLLPDSRTQQAAYGTSAAYQLIESEQMVCPSRLLQFVKSELGMRFFTGVPDSCIATFCAELDRDNTKEEGYVHAVAANEGASIGLAVGNYLATGDVPLVYMQNSGLGNAANPLLSAAHAEVYGIPMVLVIGWRGSPGVRDEPQHVVAGRQTISMLEALDVEVLTLPKDDAEAEQTMREAHDRAIAGHRPVAVLVEPETFSGEVARDSKPTDRLSREEAMTRVLDFVGPSDAVVATTGFTSRELYELRESLGNSHESDFLCVGSMGHAIAIAQGIAVAQPKRTVWCLDGDGAALMHLGSFALSASFGLSNLRHIVFNNEAHESVGGQQTAASQQPAIADIYDGKQLNFVDLASAVGYTCMGTVDSTDELSATLSNFDGLSNSSPAFLEVKVALGTRADLGRPKNSTRSTKEAFMNFLERPLLPVPESNSASSVVHSEDSDAVLLTPGPLTTSASVKAAMLHDYGSRDASFVALTARVRQQLTSVLRGNTSGLTAVLLQGSGTFAVEAMIVQFVPPESGKLLILCNGAYGRRMATICEANSLPYELFESAENGPLDIVEVQRVLDSNLDASHVAVVSCETTTGVLNPVPEIADAVASRGKRFLIDAMSSFGVVDLDASMPFDAVAASSNKALQGSPGLAFVVAREAALEESAGNANTLVLDLHSQWRSFEASGEWRFTPPTHCVLALAQALDEFEAEGGTNGRRSRYEANCKALVDGMRKLGCETLLPDEVQAPVIVTFRMPNDPLFDFQEFYRALSSRGYIIYPGKIASEPSFRVGCIGHIFPSDIHGFLGAVRTTMQEMGVSSLSVGKSSPRS